MKILALAACAALVLFALSGCNPSTAPSSGGTTFALSSSKAPTQTNQDYSTTVIDTCCADTISITGSLHWVTWQDTSGGSGFRMHANTSQLSGTGTSGNTYHGSITLNEVQKDNSQGANVFVAHEDAVMTANGGCKFTLHLTIVTVVDANGNVRVQSSNFTTTCL